MEDMTLKELLEKSDNGVFNVAEELPTCKTMSTYKYVIGILITKDDKDENNVVVKFNYGIISNGVCTEGHEEMVANNTMMYSDLYDEICEKLKYISLGCRLFQEHITSGTIKVV